MADMGTKEAAEKWGVKSQNVARWCREGRIPNATQDARRSPWHIPIDAQKPVLRRKNNAK